MCRQSTTGRGVSRPPHPIINIVVGFESAMSLTLSVSSPFRSAWLGGSRFASNREELGKLVITRQEYQEYGSGWATRRFAGLV